MRSRLFRMLGLAPLVLVMCGCQLMGKLGGGGLTALKGVGPVKSEERNVASFDRVDVGGAYRVTLKVGPQSALKVEAQENLLKEILVEVKDGELRVWSNSSFETSQPMKLTITTPTLTGLNLSGASIGDVTGIDTESFAVKLSGASRVHLAGRANDVDFESSGASEAVWDGLKAKSVKVKDSGAGTTLLSGTSDSIQLDLSGASVVKAEGFEVKKAIVNGSGACNASLNVSERLEGTLSGATTLRYKGKPDVAVETDGGSSVTGTP